MRSSRSWIKVKSKPKSFLARRVVDQERIASFHGTMIANKGDWVIRDPLGLKRDLVVMTDSAFRSTYDTIDNPSALAPPEANYHDTEGAPV